MNDAEIIDLYWRRDEEAIHQTEISYGKYLRRTAQNIVNDREDSREIVNDTYVRTWNAIPPARPGALLVWLSRITRSLAIDRLRYLTRQKRGSSQYELSLDELSECIPDDSACQEYDLSLLKETINHFLRQYPQKSRNLFLCRYFWFDSLKEAAEICGYSQSAAKTQLHRMRAALKEYLEQEGYTI